MTTGGPPKAITLGGREFPCPGDASPSVKLGGFENEHLPNGDGKTCRILKTPVTWKISGLSICIDADNGDHEFIENFQSKKDGDITITYANDDVYAGTGNIEGELNIEPTSATTSIDLAGPGKLKKL